MAVQEVDPKTVKNWLKKGEAILIDVREQSEYDLESIPSAEHYPLSSFNPMEIHSHGKRVVFHCAAGVRSNRAAKTWMEHHKASEAFNLTGGIHCWVEEGLPSVRCHRASLEVQKKGFQLAGIAVLLSAALSYFHPIFSLFTAVIGCGLLFLGGKGIAALPWLFAKLS